MSSHSLAHSGNATSGSDPVLKTRSIPRERDNITQRRRKERENENNPAGFYIEELNKLRTEIQSFLQNFSATQNESSNKICQEISEIKQEIQEIKNATESLITEQHTIRNELENMRCQNLTIQEKITQLESDIQSYRNTPTISSPASPLPLSYENITLEIQDRCNRQKNIILAGIPEINDKNSKNRREHDLMEVTKVIRSIYETCPNPRIIFRLGKHIPGKNRNLKVCFDSQESANYILRNRGLTSAENVRIYWDQTPVQQKYLQNLKNELAQRQQSGETDLSIKYSNGIPKIVKVVPKNGK